MPGDLTDRATCVKVVDDAVRDLGGLDVLVNNAGYHWARGAQGLEGLEEEQVERVLRTNLHAVMWLCQAASPISGLGPRGAGSPRDPGERCGSGADLAPLQTATRPGDDMETFGADTPLGRAGQPGEVAPAYVFLASPSDASDVSGTVIGVTGGKPVF